MKYTIAYLSVIVLTIYFTGCSELETNIPNPPTLKAHQTGILDSSSPDFHGNLVRANNWDMRVCIQCHGSDYEGGKVNASCLSCHSKPSGPENCSTCHGSAISPAPPRDLNGNIEKTDRGVGAHQVHLGGNLKGKTISCAECHVVPSGVYVDAHIDADNNAEVLMDNYLATLVTNEPSTLTYDDSLSLFVPIPIYNRSDQSCSNTYCHGHFKNGNLNHKPVWNDPSTSVCGTCHGDPTRSTQQERALPKTETEGGTHPNFLDCSQCHGDVVNANMNFVNPSKHIDGLLNIGGSDIKY